MRCVFCFFPLIGLPIGLLCLGWLLFTDWLTRQGLPVETLFRSAVLVLIPVFVTGGIHLDGFLDTSDALGSFRDREKRLEILKDSHAGAFAIIHGCAYFTLYLGAAGMLTVREMRFLVPCFVLSRTLSGLAVIRFPLARGTGLAAAFADGAQKELVQRCLLIYLAVLAVVLWLTGGVSGLLCLAAALLVFRWYYRMSLREFGGITGDLAGWFLQVCELVMLLTAVLTRWIF